MNLSDQNYDDVYVRILRDVSQSGVRLGGHMAGVYGLWAPGGADWRGVRRRCGGARGVRARRSRPRARTGASDRRPALTGRRTRESLHFASRHIRFHPARTHFCLSPALPVASHVYFRFRCYFLALLDLTDF